MTVSSLRAERQARRAGGVKPEASFPEDYYAACNAIFRRATNQTERMLRAMRSVCDGRESATILSVGSGVGLFEIPLLHMLQREGPCPARFVGVDVSGHACEVLRRRLRAEFGAGLASEVRHQPFQEFSSTDAFDLVLCNHVLEYVGKHAEVWLEKSRRLLAPGGRLLIFSPNRGGINRIYAEVRREQTGSPPFFSDDLANLLVRRRIPFATVDIKAGCDVALLREPGEHAEKLKLLSFLSQQDCRAASAAPRERYISEYLSLRRGNRDLIPHPATLFILSSRDP